MSEEKPSGFQWFLRRVRELDDKSSERLGRFSYIFYRWLLRIAAGHSAGWLGLLVIAVALGAFVVVVAKYALAASPQLAEAVLFLIVYVGFYIYTCIAIVVALVRRQMRRHLDESQLAALRMVGRVVLTITCSAVFLFPFAFVAWKLVAR